MEYENAYILKQRLLLDNEGKNLEDIIKGKEIETSKGYCYSIKNSSPLNFNILGTQVAREKLISDLKILNGIGEARERKLKEQGFHTIEDLSEHEKFKKEASVFLKILDDGNKIEITDWISRWYPKSHPLNLFASCFSQDDDFIFLDIETLGLSNTPIILLGIAKIMKNKINVKQYFSRQIAEESAVLDAFLSDINQESIFVTFNGQTFDIPFILNRMGRLNIKRRIDHQHYDMLHHSRRQWSPQLTNCKLTTLERHLFDIIREDDIPSGLVPDFYSTYLKTGNPGPLIPIIEHNRQDIITLALIFSKLHQEYEQY